MHHCRNGEISIGVWWADGRRRAASCHVMSCQNGSKMGSSILRIHRKRADTVTAVSGGSLVRSRVFNNLGKEGGSQSPH